MYKGTYNEKGEYTGFYVEGIHENIPEPYIELNEEEWQQALSKNYKVIEGKHAYSLFSQNQSELLHNIRITRDALLLESDWTQIQDSALSEEKRTEWRKYRQSLRHLTQQDDLTAVVWPTPPST